ncbi:membrane protein [Allocatelliglobosispora scoriae]|uniref:Membrane protein n=1 Tax=Allocatelliglobosispora scoriae TaxID=643052 RepID=A0A841BPG7_9ACTN|nr:YihY/virulence factor BrkB family protein [Allocatelliglobosispora scoriae]MBB5868710.1 membrane protein [Allocatelliglobosispora scoriae]
MARTREPGKAYRARLVRLLSRGPRRPSDLGWRAWFGVGKRTVTEFVKDDLGDHAAALTYYGVLSIFPGLLVLIAVVGLLGKDTSQSILDNVQALTPGPAHQIIVDGIKNLQEKQTTAGVMAIVGVVIAAWSATGYMGAFMRAANRIFDVPEGRPLWKTLPMEILITGVTGIFLAVSALAVIFTGRLASAAGRAIGVEEETVRAFDVVKWPVLILGVALLLALLYWAAPNARQGGFRWVSPGSLVAVTVWVIVSLGFALYISRFDSYNKTYGTLGGVIVFLVWLWLTNVAVLLGAEFDAELARARAIAAGLPPTAEPYLPLRDIPAQDQPAPTQLPSDSSDDVGADT